MATTYALSVRIKEPLTILKKLPLISLVSCFSGLFAGMVLFFKIWGMKMQ
ncbi:hypothetical protein DEFR109230_10160 [Deinococcus frigens]